VGGGRLPRRSKRGEALKQKANRKYGTNLQSYSERKAGKKKEIQGGTAWPIEETPKSSVQTVSGVEGKTYGIPYTQEKKISSRTYRTEFKGTVHAKGGRRNSFFWEASNKITLTGGKGGKGRLSLVEGKGISLRGKGRRNNYMKNSRCNLRKTVSNGFGEKGRC